MRLNDVDALIEKKLNRGWICPILLVFLLSIFFSFPSYNRFEQHLYAWDFFFSQVEAPLTPQVNYHEGTHESKCAFRLLPPLLAKSFGLISPWAVYLLNSLFGLWSLHSLWKIGKKWLLRAHENFWFVLGMALTMPIGTAFVEVRPIFDGMAIALCLFCVTRPQGIWTCLCLTGALFTDERAVMAMGLLPFIRSLTPSWSYSSFLKSSLDVLFSLLLYASIRHFLAENYGLRTSLGGIGLATLKANMNLFFIAQWSVFECYFICMLLSIFLNFKNKSCVILLLGYYALGVMASLFVWDVSRSMCYLFPTVLIVMKVLKDHFEDGQYLSLLKFLVIGNALFFNVTFGSGSKVSSWMPLPLEFIKWFL